MENIHFFADLMLREILAIADNNQVEYLFCLQGTIKAIKQLPFDYTPASNRSEDSLTTIFFTIKKEGPVGNNQFSLIDENVDFKLSNQRDLEDYFKNKILIHYTADKYLLFTWDHSTQFGIFREDATTFIESKAHLEIANENIDRPIPQSKNYSFLVIDNNAIYNQATSSFDAACVMDKYNYHLKEQETNGESIQEGVSPVKRGVITKPKHDKLSISELAQAIKWGFGYKKIDLLIMMNCNMQFFDIGFTLSSAVDYLVAPLSTISFNGYNYKAIFEAINTQPEISPRKLACIAVSSFKTKAFSDSSIRRFELANTILFANNLNHYLGIGAWIDRLSTRLIKIIEIRFRLINEGRGKIETLNEDYKMIDICHFLSSMKLNKYYPLTEKDSTTIKRLIKSAIIQKYVAVNPKGPNPLEALINSPFQVLSGIGVFFPKDTNDILGSDDFNFLFMQSKRGATTFTRLFKWDNFISTYLERFQQQSPL
ncbi:clostripain-related cysteine peptidase [Paraflavitalea speifideaquila]|uniref:clostripain-related cysteine peptidase n=1 Tax=Paraflavitalea speifideaquila TaxID=3076558 RepID=UPI0028EAB0E0|nr:clostripain-related cysteine peptidase [Paraflavitalea speifideiaquila]